MTTTNRLCYTVSKRYIQAGTTFEINVKILLADDCKKKQQKAENEKRVMFLDAGLSVNNVIYYDHSNELVFTKVTENDFNKFVSSVNRSLLPAGITFKKVRRITKEEGKRVNISRFPNFHKSGSIRGMKKQYYGVAALLVRCGSYIYNVTSEPNIYYNAK